MSYRNEQERSLWIRAYLANCSQAGSCQISARNCANSFLSSIREQDDIMHKENPNDPYRDLGANSSPYLKK